MKHLHDEAKCSQKGSDALMISSNDCSLKHKRNIILEQICQSLDSEGGLKTCIQNALVFQPGSGSGTTFKVCSYLGEAGLTIELFLPIFISMKYDALLLWRIMIEHHKQFIRLTPFTLHSFKDNELVSWSFKTDLKMQPVFSRLLTD